MLRLSRLADYAVVVLIRLSRHGGVATSTQLAAETGIPEATVAKVLKALQPAGLVRSQRGARGGYRSCDPLGSVSIARVIAAIDGPIALTACVEGGDGFCQPELRCPIRGRWTRVNEAVQTALDAISLADLERSTPHPSPAPDVPSLTAFGA